MRVFTTIHKFYQQVILNKSNLLFTPNVHAEINVNFKAAA